MNGSYGGPGVGGSGYGTGPAAWPYGGPAGWTGGGAASGVVAGRGRRPHRRLRAVVAVATAVAVVAGGGAVGWALTRDGRPSTAAVATSSPIGRPTDTAQPDALKYAPIRTAVTALFATRSAALRSGDLAAWTSTVDPQQPALVRSEKTLFSNLRQLPLSQYTWAYDTKTQISGLPLPDSVRAGFPAADDAYTPGMTVTYQLRGFDPRPVQDPYFPLLVRRGTRWYLAADRTRAGTFDESLDEPWTAGPIKVRTTKHVLLIVSPRDSGRLAALGQQADAAIAAVASLWPGGWRHTAVLYATRDPDVFASYLGRNRAVSEASALTTAVTADSGDGPLATRVVLDPADATPAGTYLPLLLRHEFTHVALMDSARYGAPRWVIEGIAEYTANRHHLSQARVSTLIVNRAKAHRWPARLPASSDFYGPEPAETLHYDMSWLAFEYISEKYGESKVKAMYVRLSAIAAPPDSAAALAQEARAFPALLHVSETAFVKQVQTWTARSFHPA